MHWMKRFTRQLSHAAYKGELPASNKYFFFILPRTVW
jgi:hypothetical protein